MLRPLQGDAVIRLMPGDRERAVEQRLVLDDPLNLDPARRGDHDLGRSVFNPHASSWDAKPPNTTEWIAPILAQAYMAMSASGTIGM
jgi:hypothetical protein